MAWNEPGGRKNKDPWNGGGNRDQGPDVEAFVNRLKAMLGRVFGGDGGGGRSGGRGASGGPSLGLLILGIVVLWFVIDSWQQIDERQRGVVLRFGKFDRVMPQGLNFKWPRPIERVIKVDVTEVRNLSDTVRLLTRDENIVQIEFNVQYVAADPRAYLFGTRDPDDTIKQVAESAVREVVGGSVMDSILTGERAQLAAEVRKRLQATLERYGTGLQVSVFNLQNARPPQEVRDSFDDAISAREDRERIESEAEAYASQVVPEARGEAARVRTEAEGYKSAVIERARGDAERFTLLADEYRKAPEVTRRRLYLETMQDVLGRNQKVVVSDREGNNVLYLPLDAASGAARGNEFGERMPAVQSTTPRPAQSPRTPRDSGRPNREESSR